VSVKPDQFDIAVSGRRRCREAVIQWMTDIRPEQMGASGHG
jgi:hypothetical protein